MVDDWQDASVNISNRLLDILNSGLSSWVVLVTSSLNSTHPFIEKLQFFLVCSIIKDNFYSLLSVLPLPFFFPVWQTHSPVFIYCAISYLDAVYHLTCFINMLKLHPCTPVEKRNLHSEQSIEGRALFRKSTWSAVNMEGLDWKKSVWSQLKLYQYHLCSDNDMRVLK